MPWRVTQRLEHVGPPDDSTAKIHLKYGGRRYSVVCIGTFDHIPTSYLAVHPDFLLHELTQLVDAEWKRLIDRNEAELQVSFEHGALTSDQYKGSTPEERLLRTGCTKSSIRISVDDPKVGGQLRVRVNREAYTFPGIIVGLEGSA